MPVGELVGQGGRLVGGVGAGVDRGYRLEGSLLLAIGVAHALRIPVRHLADSTEASCGVPGVPIVAVRIDSIANLGRRPDAARGRATQSLTVIAAALATGAGLVLIVLGLIARRRG